LSVLHPSAARSFPMFWISNKVRQYNRIFSSNTGNFKSCSVLRCIVSSNYKYTVPVSISCMCAQDYGYGSVRSAVSVSSSASHQKLENIDWNQQQVHRSETVSPEGQKPSEQVSVCHSMTAQLSRESCLRLTQMTPESGEI
jgi:hypothetical protein